MIGAANPVTEGDWLFITSFFDHTQNIKYPLNQIINKFVSGQVSKINAYLQNSY